MEWLHFCDFHIGGRRGPQAEVLKSLLEQVETVCGTDPNRISAVFLVGDNDNAHSLLIVRNCLGDVIEKVKTPQEQLEVIYQTFKNWVEILFDDGALEKAFKKAGLDSGM
jgi:hypothetical protein